MFRPTYSIRSLVAVTCIVAIAVAFAAKVGLAVAVHSLGWAMLWTVVLWLIAFANPETRGRIRFIWFLLVVVAAVTVSGQLAIVTQSVDDAELRLPPPKTETETYQAFVFVGTVGGLLCGILAGLGCLPPIGMPSQDSEFVGVVPQLNRFSKRLTLARSCILAALMTFVGIGAGAVVALLCWGIGDVHPADKWFLLDVYGKLGAMIGFAGGCMWCGTLAARQFWYRSPRAGEASPTACGKTD